MPLLSPTQVQPPTVVPSPRSPSTMRPPPPSASRSPGSTPHPEHSRSTSSWARASTPAGGPGSRRTRARAPGPHRRLRQRVARRSASVAGSVHRRDARGGPHLAAATAGRPRADRLGAGHPRRALSWSSCPGAGAAARSRTRTRLPTMPTPGRRWRPLRRRRSPAVPVDDRGAGRTRDRAGGRGDRHTAGRRGGQGSATSLVLLVPRLRVCPRAAGRRLHLWPPAST